MSKYKPLLKLSLIYILSFIFQLAYITSIRDIKHTTKDPEFMSEYNVFHINEGNNKTYPKVGDTVKINFLAKDPNTFKLWYSSVRQPPLPVEIGKEDGDNASMLCWDNVLVRMSKREKVYVVCKSELVYDGKGNQFLPAGRDVGWELEIVSIKRHQKNKSTKKKSNSTSTIDNNKKDL